MRRAYSSKVDVSRLCDAIYRSRQALQRPREKRREMVRQYVGAHWSEDGADQPVPINLLGLYVEIVSRQLVAKNPRMMLSTDNQQAKYPVAAMEQWLNDTLENSDIASTLHRITVDALFSIGIAKVALATPADAALAGYSASAGEPFVDRVDLDDFVFDVFARDFSEAGFIGHRYRVPLDAARSMFGKSLEATEPTDYNQEGDERIRTLFRGIRGQREEAEDYVDLWEIYLPRQKLVLTLAPDAAGDPDNDSKPLHQQPWVGPDCGPFHFLCYGVVPGNAWPKAPLQDLYDLHNAVNNIYRKSIRQARDQKRVTLFAGLTDTEMREINEGADGSSFRVSSLQGILTQDMNGPNAANAQMGIHLKDLFSWRAGNLDVLGGLSPQAKTASQEKMLGSNASGGISDMQDVTVSFVSKVMGAATWYHWLDPFHARQSLFVPGGMRELATPRAVTPLDRARVPWKDVRCRIDPYSIRHSTPEMRAASLIQVMTQLVMPMAPLLQQQGISPDMAVLLQKLAKYMDMPDLPEILRSVAPPPQAESQETGGEVNPNQFTPNGGEYTRRSLGADTQASRENDMANNMAAAGEPSAQQLVKA